MIIRLLLILCTVYARMPLHKIKEAHEILFRDDNSMMINPDGRLNLLSGYISHKAGYMHNKRFFSPEIETNYSMKKSPESTESVHVYTYTRNPESDKVYKEVFPNRKKIQYLYNFHLAMIYMFPSESNSLSIESCKSDSITRFLRFHSDKLDSMYLLASLLLLSEGVYVPIEIEKNIPGDETIILRGQNHTLPYINISMRLLGILPNERGQLIYQKETEEIIEFFKKINTPQYIYLLKEYGEPKTQSEFTSGEFLNSLRFLIQSYIFEYIDEIEQYIALVNCVMELLDYINSHRSTSKNRKNMAIIANRSLFVKKEVYSTMKNHIIPFCDLKSEMEKEAVIPFTNNAMVLAYTRVPEYYQNDKTAIKDETLYYNNHVETMLLNLFCCLTYNPETKMYTTEHIKSAPAPLRRFFDKHSLPTECASQEMHRDWCKVVSGLFNPNIGYARNSRNEVLGGLVNILYVISEITGGSTIIDNAIGYITSVSMGMEIETHILNNISNHLQLIFSSLTKSRKVHIYIPSLTKRPRKNGVLDIFGSIILKFVFNNESRSVMLNIMTVFSKFSLIAAESCTSVEICTKLQMIKEQYENANNYIGHIILEFANANLEHIEAKKKQKEDGVSYSMPNITKYTPNEIFVWRPIDSLSYKCFLVKTFLISTSNIDISINKQFARFTKNIIGSVSLDNQVERKKILSGCVYNLQYATCYPNIEYNIEQLPDLELSIVDIKERFAELISGKYLESDMQTSFYYLLQHPICNRETLNLFGTPESFKSICVTPVKKYTTEYKNGAKKSILMLYWTLFFMKQYLNPIDPHAVDNVFFAWLTYACSEIDYNSEVIACIYGILNYKNVSVELICNPAYIMNTDFNRVLSVLLLEKNALCIANNPESEEKYEMISKYFEQNTASSLSRFFLTNPVVI
ncbi:hypothetical protein NEIG_01041 [Nematocida sp. ERTm5]|nr:hypothetical protein NEIG_01041 [Nematocida sp. ERTm5]